jgi:hypothetical protein
MGKPVFQLTGASLSVNGSKLGSLKRALAQDLRDGTKHLAH